MSTENVKAKASELTVKQLEIQKMEMMVKIREQHLELQKLNTELVRHGVDIQTALNW